MHKYRALIFQVKESFVYAIHGINQNKTRAFLSTLGITIGIYCIIMVLTMVNSLERNIQDSVDGLGKDVLFVDKWPWEFSDDYQWWKYMNRPNPKLDEMEIISERSELADACAFLVRLFNVTIKYENNSASSVTGNGVTHDYYRIKPLEFEKGRYFTESESRSGAHVVLIGSAIAENLFGLGEPIDKEITIKGRKYKVIGVFAKEGESLLGNSMDNTVLLPLRNAAAYIRVNSDMANGQIQIKPKAGINVDLLQEEINVLMRAARKLKPNQEQNYALNKTSLIAEPLKRIFSIVNVAGWIIGLFSMMVGGFGISNIMFVSVKERTNQIGIQKALGAKSYFILIEFLTEAILLCLVGGFIGMLCVAGSAELAEKALDFNVYMSFRNIVTGIAVSVGIGVLSGFIPARTAARLNPVDAMRAK
jgi:putative ABC transport system permease protein